MRKRLLLLNDSLLSLATSLSFVSRPSRCSAGPSDRVNLHASLPLPTPSCTLPRSPTPTPIQSRAPPSPSSSSPSRPYSPRACPRHSYQPPVLPRTPRPTPARDLHRRCRVNQHCPRRRHGRARTRAARGRRILARSASRVLSHSREREDERGELTRRTSRYQLQEKLGVGSFGVVYKAYVPSTSLPIFARRLETSCSLTRPFFFLCPPLPLPPLPPSGPVPRVTTPSLHHTASTSPPPAPSRSKSSTSNIQTTTFPKSNSKFLTSPIVIQSG